MTSVSQGRAGSSEALGRIQDLLFFIDPQKKFSVLGSAHEKQKWFSSLQTPGQKCGLPFSFLERSEFVERVPEERRLPLGFCQGKHLLLGDAGGHSDVALVEGVQALVRRGHGASAVA